MNLDMNYRSVQPNEVAEERLISKLTKIDEKLTQPAKYKVQFDYEGHDYQCQISFSLHRQQIVAKGSGENLFQAIDEATDRAERQARKIHRKQLGH